MKLPDLKTRMSQLIALPSVSCTHADLDMSNRAVIDQLADWFSHLGFKTEIQPVPNQPHKANLIATLGQGPGGLVLAGHTDTVPFNEERWQSDPLKLSERDNRLYGLGTCDMKGFFSVVIEAVLPYLKTPLKQPLIILATADEESSMSGARALAEAGYPKARQALIGEPTSLTPIHMHKGIMMEVVRIQGKAGHSSNPALGNNALDAMHDVMGELKSFRHELTERFNNQGFQVTTPTLNLGCIHGGDNPNRICGHCELQYDLRALPGMSNDDLREEISQRLKDVALKHQVELSNEALFEGVPSFSNEKTSAMISKAEELSGYSSEAVAFATEAPFLQSMGMDTVVLGPGSIDQAHQPDEFMALDQITPMVNIIRGLIDHFCVKDIQDS
jgi:acetylornithine deacetylase